MRSSPRRALLSIWSRVLCSASPMRRGLSNACKPTRFRNLLLAGTTLRFEAVSNCFRRGAQMSRIPALRQTRRLAIGCGFSRERARRKRQSWNRFTPSQIPRCLAARPLPCIANMHDGAWNSSDPAKSPMMRLASCWRSARISCESRCAEFRKTMRRLRARRRRPLSNSWHNICSPGFLRGAFW